MPVYRAKIAGRIKTVLLRAESVAKAKDQLVDLDALTTDQMGDALESGEVIWKPGDAFPADFPAEDFGIVKDDEPESENEREEPMDDNVQADPPVSAVRKSKAAAE